MKALLLTACFLITLTSGAEPEEGLGDIIGYGFLNGKTAGTP